MDQGRKHLAGGEVDWRSIGQMSVGCGGGALPGIVARGLSGCEVTAPSSSSCRAAADPERDVMFSLSFSLLNRTNANRCECGWVGGG